MKLSLIPSPSACVYTEEYLLEAFGDMRFSFQVYQGIIEHTNDYEIYGWTKGRTMEEVVEWTEKKEAEESEFIRLAKEAKRNFYTKQQERILQYEEERNKRKAWEAEHYTEGEKGEGWFAS